MIRFFATRDSLAGTGYGRTLWPVLALLLVAVLTPTICALWFMAQAMTNERLAIRQRLENAYARPLENARQAIDDFWRRKSAALGQVDPAVPAQTSFAQIVRNNLADSVVLFDTQGTPLYPGIDRFVAPGEDEGIPTWRKAGYVEFAQSDPARAADLYAGIARETRNVHLAAQALQAQARCLVKSGRREASLEILLKSLGDARFREARDPQGRLVAPNAQLFALSLLPRGEAWSETARQLIKRLNDYDKPVMPASQRRFLMTELWNMRFADPGTPDPRLFDSEELPGLLLDPPALATLDAENLAAEFIERGAHRTEPGLLLRSSANDVWQWTSHDGRFVALFRGDRLAGQMESLTLSAAGLSDVSLRVRPAAASADAAPLLTSPAGTVLPDWRLTLHLAGPDPFSTAARKRIAAYAWTALLVIATAGCLAILLARYLGRQVRLTRLKNDLIATVSHELKTPLTSIRVLTDTLLAGRSQDEAKTREYLQMIARENVRLSRLIDSFLTFSRMERNKRKFDLRDVRPADVVRDAVEAVRERYAAAGFSLEVDSSPELPAVLGDRDALVTVLVNLLDNAWKYSQNDKRVSLRTSAADGEVRFEVSDHGIGLSRRDVRRIFEKFYQVDRSLSRETSGVGLGLSIVKFIVDAHRGRIDVTSKLGAGSTFTIRLPISEGSP